MQKGLAVPPKQPVPPHLFQIGTPIGNRNSGRRPAAWKRRGGLGWLVGGSGFVGGPQAPAGRLTGWASTRLPAPAGQATEAWGLAVLPIAWTMAARGWTCLLVSRGWCSRTPRLKQKMLSPSSSKSYELGFSRSSKHSNEARKPQWLHRPRNWTLPSSKSPPKKPGYALNGSNARKTTTTYRLRATTS